MFEMFEYQGCSCPVASGGEWTFFLEAGAELKPRWQKPQIVLMIHKLFLD
jgi:hypothetical protein